MTDKDIQQEFPLYSRIQLHGRFNPDIQGAKATVVGYTTFQTGAPALLVQKDTANSERLRWNANHASLLADQYTASLQYIPNVRIWKLIYHDSIGTPRHSMLLSIRSDKHLEAELNQRGLAAGEITKDKTQLTWPQTTPQHGVPNGNTGGN